MSSGRRLRRRADIGDDDDNREHLPSPKRRSQPRLSQSSRFPERTKRQCRAESDSSSNDEDGGPAARIERVDNDGGDEMSGRDGEVSDVMRFIVRKNAAHEPCKSGDLSKIALAKHPNHMAIGRVLEMVARRFNDDMGYELVVLDSIDSHGERHSHARPADAKKAKQSNQDGDDDEEERARSKEKRPNGQKLYVLRNAIDCSEWIKRILSKDSSFNSYRGLLIAIYGFLHIRNGSTAESDLFDFLSKLGLEANSKHATFGDIRKQIATFVRQQFLHRTKIDTVDDAINVYEYRIGAHGLKLISDRDIRKFVSAVMGIEFVAADHDE